MSEYILRAAICSQTHIVHNPFISVSFLFFFFAPAGMLMEDTFMFIPVTASANAVLSLHRLSFLPNRSYSDNGKRILSSEQESLDSAGVF